MEIPGIGRPLKRTRITRACEQCRARKVKCNGDEPCITCWQHNQACTYRSSGTASQARSLPQSVPSTGPDRHAESGLEAGQKSSPARYNPDEYRQQLELRAGIGVSNSQTGSFQFYGPSSNFCFIQRIYQRMKRQTNMTLLGQQKTAVPDGLGQWGLERFMFAAGSDTLHMRSGSTEAFLSKENGHRFINAYFSIIHPHMPILSKRVIAPLWDQFWDAPTPGRDVKSKDVVYMVLALGARAMPREEGYSIEFLDKWADHFWAHSNNFSILFQEPSVKGTHLLLLKAMFAVHGMRPNDAYLYLGHAARSVLALGINRSQVANGSGEAMHRLRVTFWVVYYYERICAFFTGRPSGFLDTHIDVSYPEDLPEKSGDGPTMQCGFVRAMSQIGQLIEKVSSGIFSLANLRALYDNRKVDMTIVECSASLQAILNSLPPYLQFFEASRPKGLAWQEIQCAHVGLAFHLIKMMMHRPALVYAGFHSSEASSISNSNNRLANLQSSIDLCIQSAEEIIRIARDVIFHRAVCIRSDASIANYIVSACVTLLYNVLNSSVTTEYARAIFSSVESGIHCLDQMEHFGPITGKALSMDIMKSAKDALMLSTSESNLEQDLLDDFPWLNDVFNPPKDDQNPEHIDQPVEFVPEMRTESLPISTAAERNADDFISASISGVDYMSYWLNGNFTAMDFPESLY